MLGVNFFSKAGATGQVYLLSGGKSVNRGLAYSGIIWPATTVAVVPTTSQIIPFAPEARTKDNQRVVVTGDIKVKFNADKAISQFDFTVDARGGEYQGDWEQALNAVVLEHALLPILEESKEHNVADIGKQQREFSQAVIQAMSSPEHPLAGKGIVVESCSIVKIEPTDQKVVETIGSAEKQVMLTKADADIHTRRLAQVTNDRTIKQYESDTAIELEKKNAVLIAEQAKNEKAKAEADAKATEIRLAPLAEVEAGKLLGAALMKAAETGRMGSIAITSEFLAAAQK